MEGNFIKQLSRYLTTTTFLSEPHKHVSICEEATFRMDITHATAIKGTCITHTAKQLCCLTLQEKSYSVWYIVGLSVKWLISLKQVTQFSTV